MVGFFSKKPTGIKWNPQYSTGITGQSSGLGVCVTPKVCQVTKSHSLISRLDAVNSSKPPSPECITEYSPPAACSPLSNGVAHRLCLAKDALFPGGESG